MQITGEPSVDRVSTDDDVVVSSAPSTSADEAETGPWSPLVPTAGVVVLVALAAWGLGRRSAWVDEAISVGATRHLVETWNGTGGTMGLYYAVLAPWSWISTERAWLRLLSVVFVAAAVVVVWSLGKRLGDRRFATLAVAFTATSWAVVRYAQEARSYALVLLLTSVSWLALVAAIQAEDEDRRRRWLRLHLLTVALAPLAHGLAVLQLAAQLALLATSPERSVWLRRLLPTLVTVFAVVAGLTVLGASDVASWIQPLDLDQVIDYLQVLTGPSALAVVVLGGGTLAGAVVAVARAHRASTDDARLLALVPVAWGLGPVLLLLVLSAARPYLLGRYVVASAPGLALLLAGAVAAIRPPSPRWRPVLPALPALAVLAVLAVGQVQLHRDGYDDWEGAAAVVAADVQAGDALVFPNPTVRMAFDYAWLDREQAPAHDLTPISPVEPVDEVRRFYTVIGPDRLPAATAATDHDRIWVVAQDTEGFPPAMDPFLATDEVAGAFRVADDVHLDGGVRVVLLERR